MDQSTTLIEHVNQTVLRESEPVRNRLSFVTGDLRDFDLGQQFRYIFIFFGGFYYLKHESERLSCLRHIQRHLHQDGLLEIEDPAVGSDSIPRKEMEHLFQEAGLALEAALRFHSFPLEFAAPDEPAVLYRVYRTPVWPSTPLSDSPTLRGDPGYRV